MKFSTTLCGTLAALLLISCGGQQPFTAAELSDEDVAALFQSAYLQPYNDKDIELWLTAFTEDAVGMHNGLPPLIGRDAVRGFGESVRDNFSVAQLDASVDEIRRSGDWIYTRGSYAATFTPNNPDLGLPSGAQVGKFLLIWERQSDGQWRIILDMGNSNGPT